MYLYLTYQSLSKTTKRLPHILKSNVRLNSRVSRTIHLRQDTLLPLRLLLASRNPALHFLLIAKVTRKLIPMAHLMQLRARGLRVLRQRHEILNRALHSSGKNLLAQIRLRTKGSRDANAFARVVVDGLHHAPGRAETAGDVDFGLLEQGAEELGEFDKVALAGFGAFFLVLEGSALEGAAGEVHEVHSGLFQLHAQVAAVFGGLPAGLEFDRVDFDADDEAAVVDAAFDFFDDLEDDAAAVFQAAAVFVGAFVGC